VNNQSQYKQELNRRVVARIEYLPQDHQQLELYNRRQEDKIQGLQNTNLEEYIFSGME
jgi:hypothetical protein